MKVVGVRPHSKTPVDDVVETSGDVTENAVACSAIAWNIKNNYFSVNVGRPLP